MFLLIYNHIGFLMGAISIIIGLLINKDSPAPAGGIAIILDLGYRILLRKDEGNFSKFLLGPRAGGQLFFLPIWVWGLFGLAIGLLKF